MTEGSEGALFETAPLLKGVVNFEQPTSHSVCTKMGLSFDMCYDLIREGVQK